ncbi:MAG: hypothetical protein JWM76_1454 [Pseudonocardiales bacterium]|nr:hypothetical protein [Pseudonocardiales bacterium]
MRTKTNTASGPTQPSTPRAVRLPPLTWLIVLAAGVGLFELLRHTLIATENPNLVPSLILVGALVVPASFVTFVYGRALAFDVTGGVLATIAVTGGLIGIIVAGTLEYDTLHKLGTLPMIGVGLIEETAKLVVPAAILLFSRRYRSRPDGLLIGVASGAGFAALETMGYAFVELVSSKGSIHAVDGVLVLRGLLSPAAHMAWTGLAAAALWAAADSRWSRQATTRFLGTFAFAVALHTAWDSIGTTVGYVIIAAIGLGALYLTANGLHRAAGNGAGNLQSAS